MLRREKLCPKPIFCPEAQEEELGTTDLMCETCPIARLDAYAMSPLGQAMTRVIEIDFILRAGFSFTLADLSIQEFWLLRMLDEERTRYEKEQIEEAKGKHGGR